MALDLAIFGAAVAPAVVSAAGQAAERYVGRRGVSACDGCGRPLSWIERAPLVGYAVVRGACPCGHRVSIIHPISELVAAALGALAGCAGPAVLSGSLLLMWGGWMAARVDWAVREVPYRASLAWSIGTALVAGATPDAVLRMLLGSLLGMAIWWVGRRWYRAPDGGDGFGLGDAALLPGIGALWTTCSGVVAGSAAVWIWAVAARRAGRVEIPAAPPLLLGGIIGHLVPCLTNSSGLLAGHGCLTGC